MQREEKLGSGGVERRSKTLLLIFATICLLFATIGFTAACGGQDGGGADESGTGSEQASLEGTRVAMVPHFRGPYTQKIVEGSRAAADSVGAELQTAGPTGIDPPAQIQAFRDIVASGTEAAVVIAYPAEQWVRPIDDAASSGIPVSSVDVASPKSQEVVHTGPRQEDLGRALGEVVAEELGEDAEGQVVIGNCIPGLDVLEARVEAFKEVFAQNAPNVEVRGPFDVSDDPSENFSKWQRLVQTNSDALAFVGVCEFDLPSLVRIKRQDSNADYEIASVGINTEGLQGVESGTALAAIGQKAFVQGYVSMKLMLDQMAEGNGKPENMPHGWINSGPEVVRADDAGKLLKLERSLDDDSYEQFLNYYQDQIDELLSDPESTVRPFEEYKEE